MKKEIKKAILDIAKRNPDIVFCGSVSLALQGLLSREVHDIDVCATNRDSFENVILKPLMRGQSKSNDGSNIEGYSVKHMSVEVDVFLVEDIDYTKINFDGVVINVERVDGIVLAKLDYIERLGKVSSSLKHIVDLMTLDTPTVLILDAMSKSPAINNIKSGVFDSGFNIPKTHTSKFTPKINADDSPCFDYEDLPF